MRKAVSEVIVAVMLLMIGVALIGAAYVFIAGLNSQAASEAGQANTQALKRMGSCLQTVSFDGKANNLYVKNCGRYEIGNVTVFIDGRLSGSVAINAKPNEIRNITISAAPGAHEIRLASDYASAATAINSVDPALAAYWNFDEGAGSKANDGSGNNNVGTLLPAGSEPQWVSGKFGNGLRFDGANDYVQISSPSGLPAGAAPRTMSAWIKLDKTGASVYNDIVGYGSLGAGQMSKIIINNNVLYFHGSSADLSGKAVLSAGVWYNVAATYDGTNVALYVNGARDASAAISLNTVVSGEGVVIGKYVGASSEYFSGIIDEVRIWNRVLSEEEIKSYMNAG